MLSLFFLIDQITVVRLDQELIEITVPNRSFVASIPFAPCTASIFQFFIRKNYKPGLVIFGYIDNNLPTWLGAGTTFPVLLALFYRYYPLFK